MPNDFHWLQMVPKTHKMCVAVEEKENSNSFLRPLLRGDDPEIILRSKAILFVAKGCYYAEKNHFTVNIFRGLLLIGVLYIVLELFLVQNQIHPKIT